jgi:glyoxylase-like metal-dependent hydrolase (beta-lactamase superfamily II)
MQGTISIVGAGSGRVHSYVSPSDSFQVTTQIIETPQRLIAIDGQYAQACADEVVQYARSLGKPLDRLIISHAHPDHYQGAGRFGVPIHALPAVRDQIVAFGDKEDPSGEAVALDSFVPTVEIESGVEVVDGLTMMTEVIRGGEAPDQLVVRLPELGVLIAQDLVYHHNHLFLGNNDIPGWLAALGKLAADNDYNTVLPGHGAPTDRGIYQELVGYLEAATELLADDGETYKKAILDRYPDYDGAFLIDIANTYLFPA